MLYLLRLTAGVMLHLCVKVNLDKLYMEAAKHVFKKMQPLLLEQRKKCRPHIYDREISKVDKAMRSYIHCIQSSELATATAHRITEELPPGKNDPLVTHLFLFLLLFFWTELFLCFTGYEKTQMLRFCLALGDSWQKDRNLEVRLCDTEKSRSLPICCSFFVVYSCLNLSRRQRGQEEKPFSPR